MKKFIGILFVLFGAAMLVFGFFAISDANAENNTFLSQLGQELSNDYRRQLEQQAMTGIFAAIAGIIFLIWGILLLVSKKQNGGGRALIYLVLALGVVGTVVFLLNKKGHDYKSITNLPETVALSIDCSQIEPGLLNKMVGVEITNRSNTTKSNVFVRVTAYDKNGKKIKEKEKLVWREVPANSSIVKPMTMPLRTVDCECVIVSAD